MKRKIFEEPKNNRRVKKRKVVSFNEIMRNHCAGTKEIWSLVHYDSIRIKEVETNAHGMYKNDSLVKNIFGFDDRLDGGDGDCNMDDIKVTSNFELEKSKILSKIKECEHGFVIRDEIKMSNGNKKLLIMKDLLKITEELRVLYNEVVLKKNLIGMNNEKVKSIISKYCVWSNFFITNYKGGVGLNDEIPGSSDKISLHYIFELSRMHRILMELTLGNENSALQSIRNQREAYFWYKNVFDMTQDEIGILKTLPSIYETSPSKLKYLPKSIILNNDVVILKLSLKNLMNAIKFLFHNQQIDFHLFVNKKVRVHTMYYIELLLTRMDEFLIEIFDVDAADCLAYRMKLGPNQYWINGTFLRISTHLIHLIRFWTHNHLFNQSNYVSARNCVPRNSVFYRNWNIDHSIQKIESFFVRFIKERISYHDEVMIPFIEEISEELIYVSLIPGFSEYNEIINSNVNDFWTRYVKNVDTKSDVMQDHLPETYEFIHNYILKFNERVDKIMNEIYRSFEDDETNLEQSGARVIESSLPHEDCSINLIEEERYYSKNHKEKDYGAYQKNALRETFEVFVEDFMTNIFYIQQGFQFWLKTQEVFSEKITKTLLKNPKFQCQYMYGAHTIQNVIYIKVFSKWLNGITKDGVSIEHFVILLHEVYESNPEIDVKVMNTSNRSPIIKQATPMNFVVIFKKIPYYCNHDIRYCLFVWMYIIYVNCNGIIEIDFEKFNIKDEISKILLLNRRDVASKRDNKLYQKFLNETLKFEQLEGDTSFKFNPINVLSESQIALKSSNYVPQGMSHEFFSQRENQMKAQNISLTEIMNMRRIRERNNEDDFSINEFGMYNNLKLT